MAFEIWAASNTAMNSGIRFYVHNNIELPEKYKYLMVMKIILMVGITVSCEIWFQYTYGQED